MFCYLKVSVAYIPDLPRENIKIRNKMDFNRGIVS